MATLLLLLAPVLLPLFALLRPALRRPATFALLCLVAACLQLVLLKPEPSVNGAMFILFAVLLPWLFATSSYILLRRQPAEVRGFVFVGAYVVLVFVLPVVGLYIGAWVK